MSKIMSCRVSSDEEELIKRAITLDARPGDRGGESAFLRAAVLERAHRIIKAHSKGSNGAPGGSAA